MTKLAGSKGGTGKLSRLITTFIPLLMFTLLAGNAGGALQAVGPTDPVSTLPTWYQDTSNLALQPCLDQNGLCVLTPPFDPGVTNPPVPITTSGPISDANFPDELFYFLADSTVPITGGGSANLRLAFEAAFLSGVSPNGGITFLRVNLKKMSGLTPNSVFTVTHPYGTFQFSTDGAGVALAGSGAAYRAEDLSGGGNFFPPEVKAATHTGIGPFLQRAAGLIVDPVSGHTFLGDPAVPVTVIGSPTGNNIFRIDGPNIGGPGINRVQTDLFTVSGRVYTAQIPTPVTLDRTTYARDAGSGQVDLFLSALTAANLVVSGTGLAPTSMTQDLPNSGKFFAHIPFGATLPPDVVVTNNLDVPPVAHPVTLVDEVNLTLASYDPATRNLTVKAASRDAATPLPVLSVPALPAPNVLDATGTLVKTLTSIPPETVEVVSSRGGQAILPVSVLAPVPPQPPLAADDNSSATAGSTITINVIGNDSSATSTLNPASLQLSLATGGSATANPNGTVSYTAPAAAGIYTFSYTVKDNAIPPATSNIATVTVTVSGGNVAPVAANDSAATVVGTPLAISVLANDSSATSTLNPVSIVVAILPGNGTALPNANGTVSYTPPAVAGNYSFSYTVKDNATPPATSNSATVSVTVAALIAPTAVNDAATTGVNTAATIAVLANDTAGSNPINASSVLIASPPASGSVTVNPAGTVTYTPALNFSGVASFTYTVKDSTGVLSNAATVTVTVAAPGAATIAVSRAQYTLNGGSWRVDGTVTPAPAAGTTLTIFNNALVGTAPLISTVAVGGNGSFTWSSANGFTAPNAQRRISIQSNQNAATKLENVTVTVR